MAIQSSLRHMKTITVRPEGNNSLAVFLLLLSGLILSVSAEAMPGFKENVDALCLAAGRPAPVFTVDYCTTCHVSADPSTNPTNTAMGLVYKPYNLNPTPANLTAVLDTFCPLPNAGVYYNTNTAGALPANWKPQTPSSLSYTGTLPVYWLARLVSDNQTLSVSSLDARGKGAAGTFRLQTAPDNCWGNAMNFGLVSLALKANVTITVSADKSLGSALVPGFALYQGWDTSLVSERHNTIYFADNGPGVQDSPNPAASGTVTQNPLKTQGLTFKGDALGTTPGGSISQTFKGLEAGNYELFVTVGNNNTSGDSYTVTVTTSPYQAGPATAPDAPLGVSAIAGNGQATINWLAPGSDGGSPLTGYTVTASPGGQGCSSTGATNCTVVGLTNGTGYTFTVTASNSVGTSVASASSNKITPSTVPDAPTAVLALPGNRQALVSWTAPVSNGGAYILGYTVSAWQMSGNPPAPVATGLTCSATGLNCVFTGLKNNTRYAFTVLATNAAGNSAESALSPTITPLALPAAPTGVTATAGDGMASVNWTAPGGAVTGYTVTSSPDGKTCSVSGATHCDVTGLTNGTSYTFTVTATNAAGTGIPSAASLSVTPMAIINGVCGSASGLPANSAPVNALCGTGTPSAISGNGPWTWNCNGSNGGTSASCSASIAAPGVPGILSVQPGDSQATVTITPPATGGMPANYTITASPGGKTCSMASPTVSCTVTGLTNSTAYTFQAIASNAGGNSPASATSAPVTPQTALLKPSAPPAPTATAGASQASVTAAASASGGVPDSITVTANPGGQHCVIAGSGGSCIVTGLTNGQSYSFTAIASNKAGVSSASAPGNSVTPYTIPDAPAGVTAIAGDGQATVKWLAPANNGGSVITGYTTVSVEDNSKSCSSATTACTITGLNNGSAYTFTVTAQNKAGNSASSAPSLSVKPYFIKPAAPGKPIAAPGNGEVTVSWLQNFGAALPTGYTVTASPGGQSCNVSFPGAAVATASCTVSGLTNGTAYTFQVSAVNSEGHADSTASDPSTPSADITGLCGLANGQQSLLAPNGMLCSTGSSSKVIADQGNFFWTCNGSGTGTTAQCGASGLTTPGNSTVTLMLDDASSCAIQSATMASPATNGQTTLPYGAVNFALDHCPTAQAVVRMTYANIVQGLDLFRVGQGLLSPIPDKLGSLAGNSATLIVADNGPVDSDPTNGIIGSSAGPGYLVAPAAPDAPDTPLATPGDRRVVVNWSALSGGPTPVRYTVTASGGQTCQSLWPVTQCTISGLQNGTAYSFTVTAENAGGVSASSSPSVSVTPSQPVNGHCGNSNGLSFVSAPVSDLCSTGTAGGMSVNGQWSWNCSGIAGGQPANCSASLITAPDTPTSVVATASNRQATVSWTPPAHDGGSPISGYSVTAIPGGASCITNSDTQCVIYGLTNSTSYTFSVTASNAAGTSLPSVPSNAITPQPAINSIFYNLKPEGALAPLWAPAQPGGFDYTGKLPVYWLAKFFSDSQTLQLSRDDARIKGATKDFNLVTSPDNCWGNSMNFGLVSLPQSANLTVTVSGDSTQASQLVPGFALYSGWDTGTNSSRHGTIYFGDNGPGNLNSANPPASGTVTDNPLHTQGLSFIGDQLGTGSSVTRTFNNLPAGNYELFITVGSNHSSDGAYVVTLATTPATEPPAPRSVNGQCGSAADRLAPVVPESGQLCQSGIASHFGLQTAKRYGWICSGIQVDGGQPVSDSRCYTLSANHKQNQPALSLSPGNISASPGQTIREYTQGGTGGNLIGYRKIAVTAGTKCQLTPSGRKLKVKLSGKTGSCTLMATKAGNARYNDVQSTPITVRMGQ